ncbi:GNAT family N-acetyltransferase [Sphingomonas sp. SORGH_AS_0879]|uniref:GNAT family N-acetyltransferase n=1 Tax=Sphingomonas sp. SORGH_AS_0879 TaxID=3041790 RepID=UPI002781592A|nr:GNAT family N-acetyltransferase [Sphingomonas sp. SORGH_AS_0879]MDQ1229695.1 GNAT superfamily N-acetyltransferase [Sphingomonas sp. SORGH_AS_0879]
MTDAGNDGLCIRLATGADAEAMLPLIRSHASYEHGRASVSEAALRSALDGTSAPLSAWIAIPGRKLVGYASATVDFSTWTGRPFLHLDCLFVQDRCRGLGVGARLLEAVRAHAVERELAEMQWQTPDWNHDAIRFYRREGALFLPKARFFLSVR